MNTVKLDCKRLAGRHSSQLLRPSERCRHGKNTPYRYPFSVVWACISTQPTSTEPFKNEEPLGILADERVSRQAIPENPFRWTVDCTRVLFRAGHTAQGPTLVATESSVRDFDASTEQDMYTRMATPFLIRKTRQFKANII